MNELFIPPAGAMQFHCTKDVLHDKAVDFVVWVMPPIPRNNTYPHTCDCPIVFRVIKSSIDSYAYKQGAQNNRNPYVCRCNGKVIE